MKPQTYKLFAQLCEGLLFEASSSLDLIKRQPGGSEAVKYLHKNSGLANDQQYQQVEKISWSELKGAFHGGWVLMTYPQGTGAIRAKSGNYEVLASTGAGEPETFRDSMGGRVMAFLKDRLGGNPRKIYVGRDTGSTKNKKSERDQRKEVPSSQEVSAETLVVKFKPLWVRATTAAIADIKGVISTMIKNDSFEKAEKKIKLVMDLTQALEEFESNPNTVPRIFTKAVEKSIKLSAAHHFPDETGAVISGWSGLSVANTQGITHLLKDISQGDTKKIGTILAFFKRNLLHSR